MNLDDRFLYRCTNCGSETELDARGGDLSCECASAPEHILFKPLQAGGVYSPDQWHSLAALAG